MVETLEPAAESETAPAIATEREPRFEDVALLIQGDDDYGVGRVAREITSLLPGIRCVAFTRGSECEDITRAGASVHVLREGEYFRGFAPRQGAAAAVLQLLRARPRWLRCARELHNWCQQEGVRVLHGNVWAHYFTLGALRRAHPGRYRTVWHTHNFLNLQRNLSLRARFNHWQVRRGADWLLCVSQAVADGWGRSGVPTRVVHNSVASRYLFLPPARLFSARPADAPVRLVGSGRMEWSKGHHVSIGALARLRAAGIPAVLDLYGGPLANNPYCDELRARIARLQLDGFVTLRGYASDFVHRLGEYDFALQCRIDPEPCSLYVLECMYRGLPLVASGGGGTPELLRDGREGLLYPPGDAVSLAQCVERLVRDPAAADRLARSARARVRDEFSPKRFARNLAAFYAEVLATAPVSSGAGQPSASGQDAFGGLTAH